MLPDFAGMAAVRLADLHSEEVSPGIAFHHACDTAFHAHPLFVGACAQGVLALTDTGVPRGPARAVAHVGFEMLLDGALAGHHDAAPYRTALATGRATTPPGSEPMAWRRLQTLCARLQAAPVPDAYADPGFVADRLQTILAGRPRLALRPQDDLPVRTYCRRARDLAWDARATLVSDVLQAVAGA